LQDSAHERYVTDIEIHGVRRHEIVREEEAEFAQHAQRASDSGGDSGTFAEIHAADAKGWPSHTVGPEDEQSRLEDGWMLVEAAGVEP
jgi:hypothetical protein